MKLLPNVLQWLSHQAANFYNEGTKNLVVHMISALILEEIMWKSRLKCGLLSKNKIVTIFFISFVIPQNGTYLKNTPRSCHDLIPNPRIIQSVFMGFLLK